MHRAQPAGADLSEHRTIDRYKYLARPCPAVDCTQHMQVVLHLTLADQALFDYTSEGSLNLTAVSLIASCHPRQVTVHSSTKPPLVLGLALWSPTVTHSHYCNSPYSLYPYPRLSTTAGLVYPQVL
eukprot:769573-Rhodomonas_salina.1